MNVVTRWNSDGAPVRKQQLLDWSAARDSGLFRFTLIPRGHGRVDPWDLTQELTLSGIVRAPVIAVNLTDMSPQLWSRLGSYHVPVLPHFIREGTPDEEFKQRLDEVLRLKGPSAEKNFFYASSEAQALAPSLAQHGHRLTLMGPQLASGPHPHGQALGICARKSDAEAVSALQENFPLNRAHELAFALRLSAADSWGQWAKEAATFSATPGLTLYPMAQAKAPVPYVVGSYARVAEILAKESAHFFMIDYAPGELEHVRRTLELLGPG